MPIKYTNPIFLVIATLLAATASAEDRHDEHAHGFARDVDAFHAVLAPLWHAPAGQERTRNVCAQVPQLEQKAKAIRSANAKPLLTAIADLKAQCRSTPAAIDAAFAPVHEAFHRLVEHPEH